MILLSIFKLLKQHLFYNFSFCTSRQLFYMT